MASVGGLNISDQRPSQARSGLSDNASAEDALAAVDFIIKEGADSVLDLGGISDWDRLTTSLFDAIKGYIEGRAL